MGEYGIVNVEIDNPNNHNIKIWIRQVHSTTNAESTNRRMVYGGLNSHVAKTFKVPSVEAGVDNEISVELFNEGEVLFSRPLMKSK